MLGRTGVAETGLEGVVVAERAMSAAARGLVPVHTTLTDVSSPDDRPQTAQPVNSNHAEPAIEGVHSPVPSTLSPASK